MNARSTAVQGVLAVAGLAAAYLVWQRPPKQDSSGKVTVVSATKTTLEKVRLERKDGFVELVRDTSGAEPQLWLHRGAASPTAAPAPLPPAATDGGVADAAAAPAPPPPPPIKLRPGQYKAGERAARLHERLAPLQALRLLGKLPAEKMKELGLEGTDKRLELTVSGTRRAFKVASSDGGGTYLLDEADGQTWLISGSTLFDLEAADVLVDRRLHTFDRAEVDGFVVTAKGKSRSFVQKAGENPMVPGTVAPAEKPDQPDEQARNWHQKAWTRISATQVLPKGELPGGAEPEPVLRVDYTRQGKPKGWLEIAKAKDGGYVARTEHTLGWVLVGGIDDVVDEAAKIVGGG